MIFAFPLENISPIDNNYTNDEIYKSLDNLHPVDKENLVSKIERTDEDIQSRHDGFFTPNFTAFRRKKALHGAHVGTPKLIPTALSPHTEHWPSIRVDMVKGKVVFFL